MRGAELLRFVGRKKARISHFKVRPTKGGRRIGRVFHAAIMEPYMPKSYQEPLHPGGNSVCYCIQHAHLMGADPIVLVGFTLQADSGYAFGGSTNPVHGGPPLYEVDRAMDWLRFYEKRYPGRVKLDPSFSGPLYDVFQVDDSLKRGNDATGNESESNGRDVHGEE